MRASLSLISCSVIGNDGECLNTNVAGSRVPHTCWTTRSSSTMPAKIVLARRKSNRLMPCWSEPPGTPCERDRLCLYAAVTSARSRGGRLSKSALLENLLSSCAILSITSPQVTPLFPCPARTSKTQGSPGDTIRSIESRGKVAGAFRPFAHDTCEGSIDR